MNPAISCVLATKNRAAMLADCLASFPATAPTSGGIEVVVVDDASIDETVAVSEAFATRVPYPVRCVPNEGRGQNAGRNTGIRHSVGDIIVFVDDDEQLVSEYFAILERLVAANPDADCLGGPYLEMPGRTLRTCRRCSLAAKAVLPDASGRYRSLLGGNMAIHRRCFEQVGLFDEELAGLGNESEWFERAARNGCALHIVYDEALAVWHRRDYESLRSLASKGYREGRMYHRYQERVGLAMGGSVLLALRYAVHALTRGCANGVFLAARESGRAIGGRRARRAARLRDRGLTGSDGLEHDERAPRA